MQLVSISENTVTSFLVFFSILSVMAMKCAICTVIMGINMK